MAISGEGGRETVCDSATRVMTLVECSWSCRVTRVNVSCDRYSFYTLTSHVHRYHQIPGLPCQISPCHLQTHIHPRPVQQHHLGRDLLTGHFRLPYVPTLLLPPHGLQSHRLCLHDQQSAQLLPLRHPLQNAQRQGQWTCYASTMG